MSSNLFRKSTANFLWKMFGYFTILYVANSFMPTLYSTVWAVIATTIFLSVAGAVADVTILPHFKNIPSLLMGIPGMTSIIWGTSYLFQNSFSLATAFLLALCIGPFEFALHKWLFGAPTWTN